MKYFTVALSLMLAVAKAENDSTTLLRHRAMKALDNPGNQPWKPSPPAYAQIISTASQGLGSFGICTKIEFNDDDSAVLAGFEFASGSDNTQVVVPEDGAYFIIVAPQVGSGVPDWTADFWVSIERDGDDVAAANSNVRITGGTDANKDVIVTQGIYELKEDDKISFCGSGPGTFVEYISKDGDEPGIPSIIASLFKA